MGSQKCRGAVTFWVELIILYQTEPKGLEYDANGVSKYEQVKVSNLRLMRGNPIDCDCPLEDMGSANLDPVSPYVPFLHGSIRKGEAHEWTIDIGPIPPIVVVDKLGAQDVDISSKER
jgi:hypothetical protein